MTKWYTIQATFTPITLCLFHKIISFNLELLTLCIIVFAGLNA